MSENLICLRWFFYCSGSIVGAKTSDYLLEKSRIVTQVRYFCVSNIELHTSESPEYNCKLNLANYTFYAHLVHYIFLTVKTGGLR